MAVAGETHATEQLSELRRQTELLVEKGYPAPAGMTKDAFRALVAPLEAQLPRESFVLVVTGPSCHSLGSSS